MTIDYAGGEMGSLIPSDSGVVESTTTSFYNTSFSRASMQCNTSSSYAFSPVLTSRTEAWFHGDAIFSTVSGSATGTIFEWYDSGATGRVRITWDSSTFAFTLQYWNGAAWVTAGSAITLNLSSTRQTIDIHALVNTASGSLKLYVSGTLRIDSGTIDLSGASNLNQFSIFGTGSGLTRRCNWSQLIVANESTIGMQVVTGYPSGAGSDSAWIGSYASVDEAVYSDTDFIYSGTANQVSTFATTFVGNLTGYTVKAVAVTARAKKGDSGPANLRLALRSNGANYFSGSDLALDAGYGAFVTVWNTDPDTSADWVNTAAQAVQIGVKSIT